MVGISPDSLPAAINSAEVAEVCSELVQIDTTNPPGQERAAAGYVARYLGGLGFEIDTIEHSQTRATTLARLHGSGDTPGLLFSGHTDTVPVADGDSWSVTPFGGQVLDGKIWGRGTSDMKGGLATILAACKAVVDCGMPLKGDLVVAATAGEEVDMCGARAICEKCDLRFTQLIIIPEPTLNRVALAEKGTLGVQFTTYGQAAHGATPELGSNAIMLMVELLRTLQDLELPSITHPLAGRLSRSVNMIHGGTKTNIVPDRCAAKVDIRTVPGQDHQALLQLFRTMIDGLEQRIPNFSADVELKYELPWIETPEDTPAVKRFVSAVADVIRRPAEICGVSFATEAVVLATKLHAPAIICGPGDPRLAHARNEYVDIQKVTEAARIYVSYIARALG